MGERRRKIYKLSHSKLPPSLPRRSHHVLLSIVVPLSILYSYHVLCPPAAVLSKERSLKQPGVPTRQAKPQPASAPASPPGPIPGQQNATASHPFIPLPLYARPTCLFVTTDPSADARAAAKDPQQWRFNSRGLCVVPSVCIRPATAAALPQLYANTLAADAEARASCMLARADLTPGGTVLPARDCARYVHKHVTCAQGRFRGLLQPVCPAVAAKEAISAADRARASRLDDDEVAVFVPAIPFMKNIFHFLFAAGYVAQVLDSLPSLLATTRAQAGLGAGAPPQKVALVFRGPAPERLGAWQHALFRAQLSRMRDLRVRVLSLGELTDSGGVDKTGNSRNLFCARTAVLLGNRGNVNLWPFANNSVVPTDGSSASAQAVWTRRAAYATHGVHTRLPMRRAWSGASSGTDNESVIMIETPPLALGYARRDSDPDPVPGEYIRGTPRRFSDADDAWFVQMLRDEAGRHGASFTDLRGIGARGAREQVQAFSALGVVVGIHGANLANVLFARTFGALVEVVLDGIHLPCYEAGMNSGLAYWKAVADRGTVAESRCKPTRKACRWGQNRLVKIGRKKVRIELRQKVAEALTYVKHLRKRFPSGIPIRYVAGEDRYVIYSHENYSPPKNT